MAAVLCPMVGKITNVFVSEGEKVEAGQVLCILEAMKMENEIFAPESGTVEKILVKAGDSVSAQDELIKLA